MLGVAPIAQPQYGGPKRARAIFDALRAKFGTAMFVAVHAGHGGVKAGRQDISVGDDTRDRISRHPYLADVICGQAIFTDAVVKRRMTTLLSTFRPDTIVVEQVYPYLGLRLLLRELDLTVRLVYSSQNIEHEMKHRMYEALGADAATVRTTTDLIRQAELNLARESALVAAVTQDDLETLRDMGARQLVLAPNGTSAPRASSAALRWHKANLARWGIWRSIVFVSSAHQPNWQGFLDVVGTRLGFLPPGVCVLICGSVGDLIGPRVSPSDVENVTFWLRSKKLGAMEEDHLAAVILAADLIILPINQGGGSNLKTAEALVSGRRVVATPFAFRGYEEYRATPGVHLTDTPGEFRSAMVRSLDEPPVQRSFQQIEMLRRLYWDARLAPLVEGLDEL
jgi:hypothetical protein